MTAPVSVSSYVTNFEKTVLILSILSLIFSGVRRGRVLSLSVGSGINAVPPPMRLIGLWPDF